MVDSNSATVNMGVPQLLWNEIPLSVYVCSENTLCCCGVVIFASLRDSEADTLAHTLEVLGYSFAVSMVSMGNPHCVIFVEDVTAVDLATVLPSSARNLN